MKINYIYCKKCKDSIFSFNRHDCNFCKCKSCMIDGGFDYIRVGGDLSLREHKESEISEVIKDIRNKFTWVQRYDKNNKPITSKVSLLKKLTTDHIVGILLYFTQKLEDRVNTKSVTISKEWLSIHEIFLQELIYRKLK